MFLLVLLLYYFLALCMSVEVYSFFGCKLMLLLQFSCTCYLYQAICVPKHKMNKKWVHIRQSSKHMLKSVGAICSEDEEAHVKRCE